MARTLILLRHGRTEWNDSRRAQGHTDVPLDAVGRAQAAEVARYLGRRDLAGIWTSDLSRARETAEVVAGVAGVPVKPDDRLREFDVGERAGMTDEEAALAWPDLSADWELGFPPTLPGAESYDAVAGRVVPVCREVLDSLRPGETALVVSHGACLKVAVTGLLGWPPEAARTLRGLANCHLAILEERRPGTGLRLAAYGVPPISRT